MAHRVVSLRCNDSSAIGDKADSGSQSDRRIYELTAYRVIADIEQAAQISSICGYAPLVIGGFASRDGKEPTGRANARPMTGAATKQSTLAAC
jgi:hypothetical protein